MSVHPRLWLQCTPTPASHCLCVTCAIRHTSVRTRAHTHTLTHAHTHTRIRTHAHASRHTHTHTHTHSLSLSQQGHLSLSPLPSLSLTHSLTHFANYIRTHREELAQQRIVIPLLLVLRKLTSRGHMDTEVDADLAFGQLERLRWLRREAKLFNAHTAEGKCVCALAGSQHACNCMCVHVQGRTDGERVRCLVFNRS